MAVDVLVNTEEITVLGSPPVVDVRLDIGATGQRGSKVFVGTGDPNLFTSNDTIFGQNIFVNDLYINNSYGEEYSYMYQYITSTGTNTWVAILKINPTLYSRNFSTTFIDGVSTVVIPINEIMQNSGTPLVEENFSIKYNMAGANPIASSISDIAITGINSENLSITFNAVERSGTSWSKLASTVTTHISITIVLGPTES